MELPGLNIKFRQENTLKLNKCYFCQRADTELRTINLTPGSRHLEALIVACPDCFEEKNQGIAEKMKTMSHYASIEDYYKMKIAEFEAQIEKMKCCFNCGYSHGENRSKCMIPDFSSFEACKKEPFKHWIMRKTKEGVKQ